MPWNIDGYIKLLDAIKNIQPFLRVTISHPGMISDYEQISHKGDPLMWQIQKDILFSPAKFSYLHSLPQSLREFPCPSMYMFLVKRQQLAIAHQPATGN